MVSTSPGALTSVSVSVSTKLVSTSPEALVRVDRSLPSDAVRSIVIGVSVIGVSVIGVSACGVAAIGASVARVSLAEVCSFGSALLWGVSGSCFLRCAHQRRLPSPTSPPKAVRVAAAVLGTSARRSRSLNVRRGLSTRHRRATALGSRRVPPLRAARSAESSTHACSSSMHTGSRTISVAETDSKLPTRAGPLPRRAGPALSACSVLALFLSVALVRSTTSDRRVASSSRLQGPVGMHHGSGRALFDRGGDGGSPRGKEILSCCAGGGAEGMGGTAAPSAPWQSGRGLGRWASTVEWEMEAC